MCTGGMRISNPTEPHAVINESKTVELLTIMEAAFARPQNITFNRYVLFSREQRRGKMLSNSTVHSKLAGNCGFKDQEESNNQ